MSEENQRSQQNEQNGPESNREQDAKTWEEERTTSFLKTHLANYFDEKLKEFDERARNKSQ